MLYAQNGATGAKIWQIKFSTKIRVRERKVNRDITDPDRDLAGTVHARLPRSPEWKEVAGVAGSAGGGRRRRRRRWRRRPRAVGRRRGGGVRWRRPAAARMRRAACGGGRRRGGARWQAAHG